MQSGKNHKEILNEELDVTLSTLAIVNVSYSLKAASARNSSCDDVFHLSALDLPRKRPMSHPVNT